VDFGGFSFENPKQIMSIECLPSEGMARLARTSRFVSPGLVVCRLDTGTFGFGLATSSLSLA
ncbi:hypothetical protein A2U01_0069193, partial [Trifolium medium]|nr:hypothetical protein [Trifolium medium]